MKNKKMMSMIVAVALIAVIGVGATLAYFTDKAEAKNVITMGHVDIDLTEPGFDKEDGTEDNTITNVTPNQEITKDPTITVAEGSADAYVRATITLNGLTDEQKTALMAGITINQGWFYNETEGYYYYNAKLTAGQQAVLFNTVLIPETWGNEEADLTFEIVVNAEAIQADNFEPTWNEDHTLIIAWTDSQGNAITAETYNEKVNMPAESEE